MSSDAEIAEALAARIRSLPAPPADAGEIELVVVRPEPGERITPARVRLTPEGGVEGDRWLLNEKRLPAAQISVMRADVAHVMCNGHPLSLFGDNLLVHLDLSLTNLPAGTRVMVGSALCEVTEKPHTGCAKFAARFGQAARDLTGAEALKAMRLRGLYVRVIEAGEVASGDHMKVLARS